MREDLPDWLGKPPLRGTDEWEAWLAKWRKYARTELRDAAADDPDFDFGLLTAEERWRVALRLQIQNHLAGGRENGPVPTSLALGKRVSDLDHAGVVAWQVGRSVVQPIPDAGFTAALEWSNARENPRRRRISHGIRYGFIAGLGGEPASPAWSSPDYVAAYEAAWELGNAIAIDGDPRG
ncbi:MAG: hypothetical protein WCJ96_03925 [Verrucomicrobiota bacterium]|jgi:hypothetical protein